MKKEVRAFAVQHMLSYGNTNTILANMGAKIVLMLPESNIYTYAYAPYKLNVYADDYAMYTKCIYTGKVISIHTEFSSNLCLTGHLCSIKADP